MKRITLRIPEEIHQEIKKWGKEKSRTTTGQIVFLLSFLVQLKTQGIELFDLLPSENDFLRISQQLHKAPKES